MYIYNSKGMIMYTYFISKKYTFFSKIIACAMICSNQNALFSMHLLLSKNAKLSKFHLPKTSLKLERLYNQFVCDVLPAYVTNYALAELTLSSSSFSDLDFLVIDETETNTKQTLHMLECIKSLSGVNRKSYKVLKPVYIAYIESILNTYCYEEHLYEQDQKFCKRYGLNCLNKKVPIIPRVACADFLSLRIKKPSKQSIFLADLVTCSEASYYVDHSQKIIVGSMGELYKVAATNTTATYLDEIHKLHIHENRLLHLVKDNSPKLLIFFKKIFDYTPHKDYTFVIGMEKCLEALPKDFWITCTKEGFNVNLSDRYLLREYRDIEVELLEDHYDSFHSLEVSLIHK